MIKDKRILVIDDERNVLLTFRAVFKGEYEIFVAETPEEALKILSNNEIQIVICDLNLGPNQINGVEFFSNIRVLFPMPKRVLYSSNEDHKAVIEAINRGKIHQYVSKPWSEFQIRLAIENCLQLYYSKKDFKQKTKKVFVSHSSKDFKIVTGFVDNVLKLGLNLKDEDIFCTSIDEMGIKTGVDFREQIKEQLINCRVVIQLITANYKASEVCLNEMGAAWVLNNHVIPFILEPVSFRNIGFIHSTTQTAKLNDGDRIIKFVEDYRRELSDNEINFSSLLRHVNNFSAIVKSELNLSED